MNLPNSHSRIEPCARRSLAFGLASLLAGLGTTTFLRAQTDNFDAGTDAGWSKITSPDYPATYSFPTDEFGGHAYRLQGEAAAVGSARVVAYRTDRLYTNFYMAADIVVWDAGYTNDQAFGLIARATNISSGQFDGATLNVRINRFSDSAGSRGQTTIYSFVAGSIGGPATAANCTLVPGRKYRFTFSGVSNVLSCAIYDLEDLTWPIFSASGDDAVSQNPFLSTGPFPDPNTGGYCGIFNYSLGGSDPRTDTTFDNFVASETPTTSVAAPATPHGVAGAPQVVNRSPVSFKNFHPPASGITFNATTLTTTNAINTNAIRLFLNGLDVSSRLSITGPTTNAAVAYNGLAANAVYEARIELEDALGRRTTNRWTFDTFSDAYLASSGAKNIECEDYNFNDGSFIDDPPPSGYATNNVDNSQYRDVPINGGGVGYVDLSSHNAKLGGVDFFDYDSAVHVSAYGNENDFRVADSVGTTLGTIVNLYSDASYANLVAIRRVFDTQRQKYVNVNPALYDYMVERTEGGEWLNYTRIFTNANYYNVYLRYNSELAQPLSLDQVDSDIATNNLGMFTIKSSSMMGNSRYAPLLTGAGNLAVVTLSGTNTLRLTMTGPQNGSTKQRTALNYLAFVPALLVESAAQVAGPYSIEANANVEPGTQRITIPASDNPRFYRLRWDQAVRITSIKLVGGSVEMTYQSVP